MANKFTIAFGLVTIPVKTSPAARADSISFNQLSGCCKARTKQKLVCGSCEKEVERAALLKGYEYAKDQYVTVTKEELEACEPESSKVMEIERVVAAEEVDAMLFESSFHIEPEPAGRKGYKLLLAALEAEGSYAIARMTATSREHVVIIRVFRGSLVCHTMFFESEVRPAPALGLESIEIKDAELQLARQLLRVNAGSFEHASYADGYQQAVEELLRAKQEGTVVVAMPKKKPAVETGDLLAALTASLQTKEPVKEQPKRRKTA